MVLSGLWQSSLYLVTKADLAAVFAGNVSNGNPHSRDAMGSPPSITITDGNTPPVGITQGLRYTDGTIIPYHTPLGGRPTVAQTFYETFTAAWVSSGVEQTLGWRVAFDITASKFAVRFAGDSSSFIRFIIDGVYVSKTAVAPGGSGASVYNTLDFGSSAKRQVKIEAAFDQAIDGIYVPTGQTVALAASIYSGVLFFLGDSFTESTGATNNNDGYTTITGDYLGFDKMLSSGVGGTGYVNTASGTKYNLGQRLAAEIVRAQSLGPVPIVVVAMGINDIGSSGVQTAAESCFETIRTALPDCLVFVLGPWDVNAPSAPVAGYAGCKSAIQAAVGSRSGFWFLDPQGVSYTKSDTTHPDTAGHLTLGLWLETAIRAAVSA